MSTEIAQVLSVFITGLNTTVGRELALKLRAAGHHVAGTVETGAQAAFFRRFGVTPAYADLTRAGELRSAIQGVNATVLVNAAAQTPNHAPQAAADWTLPLADYAEALEEAAAQAGAEYLLHTSFVFAGGHLSDDSEGAEPVVHAAQAAEAIALSASVPAAVARLGVTYGPADPALVALRETLRRGRPMDMGEDTVKAQWIYAADAASGLAAAIERRVSGVTLDLVDDQPLTPADFIRLFARLQAFGEPGRLPAPFRRGNALQRHLAKVETHASSAAAREALGWSPRFPRAEAGIEELLLVWRASLGEPA